MCKIPTLLSIAQRGANVNSPDRYEQSPVHYASVNGNFKVTRCGYFKASQ